MGEAGADGGSRRAPVTRQIADGLRRAIADGTYGPGALLPSEPELARQYGASRQTARSALKTLEQEGIISVHSTRGRTVRARPAARRIWLGERRRGPGS